MNKNYKFEWLRNKMKYIGILGISILFLYSCSLPGTLTQEQRLAELENSIQDYVQKLDIENSVESEVLEKYNQFKKEYEALSGESALRKDLSLPLQGISSSWGPEMGGSPYNGDSGQGRDYNGLFKKEESLLKNLTDASYKLRTRPFNWLVYIDFIRSYVIYSSFRNSNTDLSVVRFADDGSVRSIPKPLIGLSLERSGGREDRKAYMKIKDSYIETFITFRFFGKVAKHNDIASLDKIKTIKYVLDPLGKSILAATVTYKIFDPVASDVTCTLIVDTENPNDFSFTYYYYDHYEKDWIYIYGGVLTLKH